MPSARPAFVPLPLPIRTPRLILRPRQPGDGVTAAAAIDESWEELHQWMSWAENRAAFTPQALEARYRQVMARPLHREIIPVIELIGTEAASGQAVVWCGLHDIDWQARHCDTGYWVRHSAQRQGFATEAANAMIRYAFGALGMRRIGLTHSAGNEASRRIAEKLGFSFQGIRRAASHLPGGRVADSYFYLRFDLKNLPALQVTWA